MAYRNIRPEHDAWPDNWVPSILSRNTANPETSGLVAEILTIGRKIMDANKLLREEDQKQGLTTATLAHVNLIAAAPDQNEALRDLLEAGVLEPYEGDSLRVASARRKARAALLQGAHSK